MTVFCVVCGRSYSSASEAGRCCQPRVVHTRILHALSLYEQQTGKKANAIYLGYSTIQRLKAEGKMGLAYIQIDCTGRCKFMGITIYRVDEEIHLGVGNVNTSYSTA